MKKSNEKVGVKVESKKRISDDSKWLIENAKVVGFYLGQLPKKFQNNRELVFEVIKVNGNALQFASKKMQNDEELILQAKGTEMFKAIKSMCDEYGEMEITKGLFDGASDPELKKIVLSRIKENSMAEIEKAIPQSDAYEKIVESAKKQIEFYELTCQNMQKASAAVEELYKRENNENE